MVTESPEKEVNEVRSGENLPVNLSKIQDQKEGTIRYILVGDRGLTVADWASIGITVEKGVWWNERNNWTLPISDFTQNQLAYLKSDSGFRVKV